MDHRSPTPGRDHGRRRLFQPRLREGIELALALRRGLDTEVVVARSEVDVRGVDDP